MRDPGNEVATILFLIVMQQQPHSQGLSFSCISVALNWGMEERGEDRPWEQDQCIGSVCKGVGSIVSVVCSRRVSSQLGGTFQSSTYIMSTVCQKFQNILICNWDISLLFMVFPRVILWCFQLTMFQPSVSSIRRQVYFSFLFVLVFFFSLCATGSVRLKINGWVNVSFCLPHKVHNLNQGSIHIKVSFLQRRGIIKQRYTEIKQNTQESGRPVRVEFSSESCHPVV